MSPLIMFELSIDSTRYLRIRNLLLRRTAETHGTFPRPKLEKIVLAARIKFVLGSVEFTELQSVLTMKTPLRSGKPAKGGLLNVGRGYLMRLYYILRSARFLVYHGHLIPPFN